LANYLPALQAHAKVKEVQTPKFYWFDNAIVNCLRKNLRDKIAAVNKGFLLETLVFHELRVHNSSKKWGAEIYYWGTPDVEVDFVLKRGNELIAIEVKYGKIWKPDYSRALHIFKDSVKVKKVFGVYTGRTSFKKDGIEIYPVNEFLSKVLPTLF